ncbi:hypothetical protein Mar181_1085 [Marinomonas posidonica IVIA-Po-181]|uniref:Uncharacterized protein n=1 Tax=Marinomonas posidonica (strain CECT 7376 / NCIMB 14433 / IVIA-Po-181) TaxID=491952 RepID=F6CUM4_MARPP|nr:hypothetical protein Mar181_1085 [Marinomonas posidonica IVIA-Po-181]
MPSYTLLNIMRFQDHYTSQIQFGEHNLSNNLNHLASLQTPKYNFYCKLKLYFK